jgi:protein-L-isoaspartate(D-aspartate) O-methyltransferase
MNVELFRYYRLLQYLFISASFTSSRTMAWRSHGATNEELVAKLKSKPYIWLKRVTNASGIPYDYGLTYLHALTRLGNRIIQSERVEKAMKGVDRGDYCSYSPYYDSPQQIGTLRNVSLPSLYDPLSLSSALRISSYHQCSPHACPCTGVTEGSFG